MTSILSRSSDSAKILIGRVTAAHGLKGSLCVMPLTDFPERFNNMQSLKLYDLNNNFYKEIKILNVKAVENKNILLIKTDLNDRNEAEACVDMNIFIDANERVELPPDTFWIDDLLGLRVEDLDGNALGIIADLIQAGAGELYEIRDPDGRLHYIPAVSEFVKEINLEAGLIKVKLIEGLWD